MTAATNATEPLTAPYRLAFRYTRSTGPVVGAFLTGLREQRILGARTRTGKVIVPPVEYDPETSDDIAGLVEVGGGGVVGAWTWVREPRAGDPSPRPFAWALIQLDGADTAMLHVVRANDERAMRTGMRVRVEWAAERSGCIQDIACFVPDGGA